MSKFVDFELICIAVDPEDIKKLGSALNTLCNEKVKAQKVIYSNYCILFGSFFCFCSFVVFLFVNIIGFSTFCLGVRKGCFFLKKKNN